MTARNPNCASCFDAGLYLSIDLAVAYNSKQLSRAPHCGLPLPSRGGDHTMTRINGRSRGGTSATRPLYEQIAERVARMIESGVWRSGDRVESVRALHRQWSVSITTVIAAYRRLEDRGLIEARPQSGYYVTPQRRHALHEPAPSSPAVKARHVQVCSLAMSLFQAAGAEQTVKLGAAVPDPSFLPLDQLSRTMTRILRRHREASHVYDTPPGCMALRRQIVRRLARIGCDLHPDEIITTHGATEAVHLALSVVTRPGDTVAVESPTFFGTLQMLETMGLKALELPTHPRDGIDLDTLDRAARRQPLAACLLVPNFSNPLGACMPAHKKRRLAALARTLQLPLIEDDVYGDLPLEGDRPGIVKAFDADGWVMSCGSFSKSLAPGLRVGWLVAGRWLDRAAEQKVATSHTTSTVNQLTIAAFLAEGGYDRHLRRIRRAYREQVARFTETVRQSFPPGTRVTRPAGGHVLWVDMPVGVDAVTLYHTAAAEGISIAPGPVFSANGSYRNGMRLNVAVPWTPRLRAALTRLGELATSQLPRP